MAEVVVKSAFVEELVGSPVFVLKVAEPHSRKDEQGRYQTVSRTFFDVKVSRDSGISLSQFVKGQRIRFRGSQKTEVREHDGKKFYTLVVWADQIEALDAQNAGFNAGSVQGAGDWSSQPSNASQGGFQGNTSQGGFGNSEAPF